MTVDELERAFAEAGGAPDADVIRRLDLLNALARGLSDSDTGRAMALAETAHALADAQVDQGEPYRRGVGDNGLASYAVQRIAGGYAATRSHTDPRSLMKVSAVISAYKGDSRYTALAARAAALKKARQGPEAILAALATEFGPPAERAVLRPEPQPAHIGEESVAG